MSLLRRIRWGRVSLAFFSVSALWALTNGPCERAGDAQAEAAASIAKPGGDLLLERPWIDRLPRDEKDAVNHLLFLEAGGERIGVVARASVWRRHLELFRWSKKGDDLALKFPQTGRALAMKAKARPCDEAPPPMDLCLDIVVAKQAARLYSKKSWSISDAHDLGGDLPTDPDADPAGGDLRALMGD